MKLTSYVYVKPVWRLRSRFGTTLLTSVAHTLVASTMLLVMFGFASFMGLVRSYLGLEGVAGEVLRLAEAFLIAANIVIFALFAVEAIINLARKFWDATKWSDRT